MKRNLIGYLSNALAYIRKHGLIKFAKEYYYTALNKYYEIRFNVKTTGYLLPNELGVSNKDSIEYSPLSYTNIFRAFKKIPIKNVQVSLIDYGCGKGRVLVSAARSEERRVGKEC